MAKGLRFYDRASIAFNQVTIEESMTGEQKAYLSINKAVSSSTKTVTVDETAQTVTFASVTLATPPAGFPALSKTDFNFYINGMIVETDAIVSIEQVFSNVVIDLNTALNFEVSSTDEFMLTGKLL